MTATKPVRSFEETDFEIMHGILIEEYVMSWDFVSLGFTCLESTKKSACMFNYTS